MSHVIYGKDIWGQTDGLASDDTIHLGKEGGVARGHGGDDILNGSDFRDRLHGDDGNDALNGGMGRDFLYGGAGDDSLTGGHNIDTFVFTAQDTGHDVITDFVTKTNKPAGNWQDVLAIKDLGSVSDLTFTQEGNDLVISIEGRGSIRLENADISEIRVGEMLHGPEMYCYTASNAPHSNILLDVEIPEGWVPQLADGSSNSSTTAENTETNESTESTETTETNSSSSTTQNSTQQQNTSTAQQTSSSNDIITGTDGRDYLTGDASNNHIQAGDGHDYLVGGMGYDILEGGAGSDLFVAGMNDGEEGKANILKGGEGRDVFHFKGFCSSGTNEIPDFDPESDILTFDDMDPETLTLTETELGVVISATDETGLYHTSVQLTGVDMNDLSIGSYNQLNSVTSAARGEDSSAGLRGSFSNRFGKQDKADLTDNILLQNAPANFAPKIVKMIKAEPVETGDNVYDLDAYMLPPVDTLNLDAVYTEYEALEFL